MKILNIYGQEIFDAPAASTLGEALKSAYLSGAYLSRADLSRANLSGADLSRADLSAWAQVSFAGHGECGRMLTAYQQTDEPPMRFQCGCFSGTEDELRAYIASHDATLAPSRLLAIETVKALAAFKQ